MENQEVEWRPVPAHISEEHEVSSDGRIRRTVRASRGKATRGGAQWKSGKELKPFMSGKYLTVKFRGRAFSVHRIVCEAFHGAPPSEGMLARHLDDNKLNNTARNLEWGTRLQNWQDSVRNGTAAIAPQRFDRSEARRLRDFGMTWRQVGAALGVSHVAAMNAVKAAA